jgi:hypothetical protein
MVDSRMVCWSVAPSQRPPDRSRRCAFLRRPSFRVCRRLHNNGEHHPAGRGSDGMLLRSATRYSPNWTSVWRRFNFTRRNGPTLRLALDRICASRNCFEPTPEKQRSARVDSGRHIHFARYAPDSSVLPLVTETLPSRSRVVVPSWVFTAVDRTSGFSAVQPFSPEKIIEAIVYRDTRTPTIFRLMKTAMGGWTMLQSLPAMGSVARSALPSIVCECSRRMQRRETRTEVASS